MAARQRMQDLFTKYDVNGDGVLSVEEMTDVFGKLGVKSKDAETVFAGADGNKDGVIQVTEFLDWLTSTKPTLTTQQDRKEGTVRMTITNTSDRRSKRFTITFTNCKNMTFPEGNPCSFLLKPGEALEKLIMQREEEGKGWRWSYRWSSRSEFTGVEDDPNAFVDESFPHDAASVGETKTCFKVGSAELWVRARVLGDPAEAKLFDQIRPQDILQGQVGDCWLMSALASLADHPDRIRALFTSDSLSEDGKCGVRLFDVEALAWTTVEIDEFVPCKIWGGVPVPVFAKALGEEIWVQLIEKAVAKWCGSYGALSGGGVGWAYQLLTGEVNQINYAKIAGKGLWRKKKMLRQKQLERGARNPRNSWWTWRNKDTFEPEKLFGLLQEHLSSGAMLSTTIAGGTSGVEEAKGNGLYTKHFYSMLSVTSVEMDDGTPIKLMELRNPWGKSEWKGDWSDSSDRWEENPKLRKILESEVKNDGRFWIPFEEWEKMYTCVVVCPPKTKARTRKAPNPKNSMDSESDVEGDAQPRTRHRKEDELLSSSAEEDDEKEDAGDDDEDFCAYL